MIDKIMPYVTGIKLDNLVDKWKIAQELQPYQLMNLYSSIGMKKLKDFRAAEEETESIDIKIRMV